MTERISPDNEHLSEELEGQPAPPPEPAEPAPSRSHTVTFAILGVLVALVVLLTVTGRIDSLAKNLMRGFSVQQPALEAAKEITEAVSSRTADGTIRFTDLDLHPDRMHQPFTAGSVVGSDAADGSLITGFRDLLTLYEQRQGIDDNFTIRVVDGRSSKLLELFSLDQERARYEASGADASDYDWHRIDGLRRVHTRQLVDKHAAQGVPRKDITVKWGRANQVREARRREAPTIEYEVRLARYLGLSLLPTEIGTVETFNQDRLVSSVGARSRYQMMPFLLRLYGIRHYDLRTAAGNVVPVYEEWHPLISMEPAFLTLRGYINAVGHEIPGISAYHTGPGNIYTVYRSFLTNQASKLTSASTVMDAYMWAVTDGFDTVTKGTSFGSYSRGYVASGYGALRATDDLPIDTSQTMLTERVQLKPGSNIYLSQLLRTLEQHEDRLTLRDEDHSLYAAFHRLNPHINLPDPGDDNAVPVRGDIQLVSEVRGADVRFFLPLGASQALAAAGMDLLDADKTFRFDHDTYTDPNRGEKTLWDRQYDALVRDIGRFGFTTENRSQLWELARRFEQLAQANPSHYRVTQLKVIKGHQDIWRTGVWEKLAGATAAVRGKLRAPAEATTPLPAPTPPLSPFTDAPTR